MKNNISRKDQRQAPSTRATRLQSLNLEQLKGVAAGIGVIGDDPDFILPGQVL